MKGLKTLGVVLFLLLVRPAFVCAQWQRLAHSPPFNMDTMLLLTDGTVIGQESNGKRWARLTPDTSGNYVQGTWSLIAQMQDARLYYASAVLADGRVFVAGGEYSGSGSVVELNRAEMYNPLTNTWMSLPVPTGWTQIGDAACCVLSDGRLLLGSIGTSQSALYNPQTNTWTATGTKNDRSSEETWALLPDGTVLAVECANHPRAEKYVPTTGTWVSAGTIPVDLVEASSIEVGAAILRPDGTLFAIGATGRTAIYTPPLIPALPGSWVAGPTFPRNTAGMLLGAKDAPACLLPNGNVLCSVGPVDGVSGNYLRPTSFFEYDGTSLNPVASPPNAGGPPFAGRMLLLPTGQVLYATGGTDIEVYTSTGTPSPAWLPLITNCPVGLVPGASYTLQGQQINGLSQAVGYGDDASMATNYPLVRIHSQTTGKIWYCRTSGHSTMGVATGASLQTTNFAVPSGIDLGPADLSVVANGLASPISRVFVTPMTVTISGMVTLQGCVASAVSSQPITFEFRPTDGSETFTQTQTLASDGSFTITNIPANSYNLAIKGDKWLRKVLAVDASSGSVSGLAATLLAGDVTNHNAVTTSDYLALKAAFGSTPSDPNWNSKADLNCDGTVSTADYLLLKSNFGMAGDP